MVRRVTGFFFWASAPFSTSPCVCARGQAALECPLLDRTCAAPGLTPGPPSPNHLPGHTPTASFCTESSLQGVLLVLWKSTLPSSASNGQSA